MVKQRKRANERKIIIVPSGTLLDLKARFNDLIVSDQNPIICLLGNHNPES